MKIKPVFLPLYILLLSPFLVFAQQEEEEVLGTEIDIAKPYQPKLNDAAKRSIQPKEDRAVFNPPDITYQTTGRRFDIMAAQTTLPAVSIGQTKLKELRPHYLKTGFGNYADVFAEYGFNSNRSKENYYYVKGLHHSGRGPTAGEDDWNSNFNRQNLQAGFQKILNNFRLSSDFQYQRRSVHFYGYDREMLESDPDSNYQQAFNDISLQVSLDNFLFDDSKIQFQAEGGIYYISDRYDHSELGITFNAGAVEEVAEGELTFNVSYDYYVYEAFFSSLNRSILGAGAIYEKEVNEQLTAEVGIKAFNAQDSSSSQFHLFPHLHATYLLDDYRLSLYGGLSGNLEVNTFRDFSYDNPFITNDLFLNNTVEKIQLNAGAKGRLGNRWSYMMDLKFSTIENLALFVNDFSLPYQNRFGVLYDTGNVTRFRFATAVNYDLNERLQINAQAAFLSYGMSSLPEAYHLPTFESQLSAFYQWNEKVGFRLGYLAQNARPFLAGINDEGRFMNETLDGFWDINAGIDYRFSSMFTAYIFSQNILGNGYEWWNRYEVRGFQIRAGVKMSF